MFPTLIDFSGHDLKPGTLAWDLTRSRVRTALEEHGCFEARFGKISPEVRNAMLGFSKEVLDLPLETKMKNVSKTPFNGYSGQNPYVPLYEGIGIDDPNITQQVEDFTKLMWPQGNIDFSITAQKFSEKLIDLEKRVSRMILESFGLEGYIEEHNSSRSYLLKIMKYEGPKTLDKIFGLKRHTDKTIMSLLCQNEIHGLEVQTKDGQWFDIKPSPDSFIVMVGDYFYAMMNGRVHVPYHRVMMSGKVTRYSIGLFSLPKEGYTIEAPQELVDEDHPLLFKPFDHTKFLSFYNTEEGLKSEFALKAYCGLSH